MGALTFTLDLEDHRPDTSAPVRYPDATRAVLELLARRDVRGTFFVIATVAREQPGLVRDIAAAGHEIALHGWEHTPLVDYDEASFRDDLLRSSALLEDLAGSAVVGFRAPTFSLVPTTVWATETLAELGFTYSSSVLPAANPLYGYPGAPSEPFLWPSGLAEFPVPITGLGRLRVPYLGGTYLRLIPGRVSRALHRRRAASVPWTYVHPYDLDVDEPYWRVPDAGRLSRLLWVGRAGVLAKLDALLASDVGPPFRDRIAAAAAGGTYDPAVSVTAPSTSMTPAPSDTP